MRQRSVADGIQEGRSGLVPQRERLKTAHDRTVGDDGSYLARELLADVGLKGLQHLIRSNHERGHHNELNMMIRMRSGTKLRSNETMATFTRRHKKHREAHDDCLLKLHSDGQCRAQMPKTCTVMGLLSPRSARSFRFFLLNKLSRLDAVLVFRAHRVAICLALLKYFTHTPCVRLVISSTPLDVMVPT